MTTSTTQLTRIRDDLWQTRTDTPFPGLTTHAYLWRGPRGNVLFYSPATEADFDALDALGGVSAQYLSHLDEAGPNLKGSKNASVADCTRRSQRSTPLQSTRASTWRSVVCATSMAAVSRCFPRRATPQVAQAIS